MVYTPANDEGKMTGNVPSALDILGGQEVVSDQQSEQDDSLKEEAENGNHYFNYDLPLDSDKE